MIRKATLKDAPAIQKLINSFAARGEMLPRPLSELYENIREYFVSEERGAVTGTAGLHINWDDLAEIKSVAVKKTYQGRGIGRQLVAACLAEGQELGLRRFYVLTYVPDFFKRFGFRRIDRKVLPHKVWTECVKCPKFPDCDEVALLLDSTRRARRA
jgi:amino-acid N-acetyltransferase